VTLPVDGESSKPSERKPNGLRHRPDRANRHTLCNLDWRNALNVPLIGEQSGSFANGFEIASAMDEEKTVMEMVLAITLVSWAVVGVNLLFTYDKDALADAN
jgi:hypothetical protein